MVDCILDIAHCIPVIIIVLDFGYRELVKQFVNRRSGIREECTKAKLRLVSL